MNKLIAVQLQRLSQLINSAVNYGKEGKKRSVYGVEKRLKSAEEIYQAAKKAHIEILQLWSGEEIPYFQNDKFGELEERYFALANDIQEFLQPETTAKLQCGVSSGMKLPKIELPHFYGAYEDWVSFRDLFSSLIKEQDLSEVQKMHYLKSCVFGEAATLLRPYNITAANFNIAWQVLVERYENKRVLLDTQFKRLLDSSIVGESAFGIRKLLDSTLEAVKAIENLSVDDIWNALLVHVITQKLPMQTRQLWEQQIAINKNLPSFEQIRLFLENRFRALEAITPTARAKPSTLKLQSHFVQREVCPLCKENDHCIRQCSRFVNLNFEDRFNVAKQNGLCINCLTKGHIVSQCVSKVSCAKCGRRHHALLHKEVIKGASNPDLETLPTIATETTTQTFNNCHAYTQAQEIQSKNIVLATALVCVESLNGNSTVLRALVDQGSQASFISEYAANQLALKRKFANIGVSGIGQFDGVQLRGKVVCQICISPNEYIPMEMLVLKKITSPLPVNEFNISNFEHLKNLRLADPHYNKTARVDMLLGADVVSKILLPGIIRGMNGPIAQNTSLGWIISGEVTNSNATTIRSFAITKNSEDGIAKQLRKFWEVEEVSTQRIFTTEEANCESFYCQNTFRSSDGRFTTRLPFKNDYMLQLGSSRQIALNNLTAIERRLAKDPELNAEYKECINEYLKLGHMVPALDTQDVIEVNDGRKICIANYLPHHAVLKDSCTTKVRVVFDAARKTKSGLSLNDVLMTGPCILNKLSEVLLRWRLFIKAFAADIEKMYRQVRIHEEDANYQRILWRDASGVIRDYCLTTVTFGTTCAPYLAIRTLQQAAEQVKETNPPVYTSIMEDFYMDDYLSGADTLEEAITKQTAVRTILNSAGFKLRKWIANDNIILQNIDMDDQDKHTILSLDWDNGFKTLGVVWYPSCDSFSYKIKLTSNGLVCSKRTLLSEIARLFDPMGWLSPIIIRGKILMQALWLSGTDWDSTLPKEISDEWNSIRKDLVHIEDLRVPRLIKVVESEEVQLHGFCDASNRAYAAVVYLVSTSRTQAQSSLIMTKTKVAPIRPITIPRLELCGAVLLAKLIKEIKLSLNLAAANAYLWTDSTIVLSWLKGHPSKWSVYVANRTSEIHTEAKDAIWQYVPTTENPADIATRGIDPPSILKHSLWWNGPQWLPQWRINGPKQLEIPIIDLETRKHKVVVNTSHCTEFDYMLEKFSNLNRLIRVTAYCYRFAALTKKVKPDAQYLSTGELRRSLLFWIKYTQRTAFSNEISALIKMKPIEKNSKILKLNPFLHEGILRVGGRLENADICFDKKHPIILPKHSRLTTLIIEQYHLTTLHGGAQLTLNLIRTKYWIVNGKQVVSQHIHRCVICFRHRANVRSQLMGNLPSPRVNISRPFSHTGVDYCGPIYIKNGKGRGTSKVKGYVAIFICLAIKAIHIELVGDLTTESFLAALKRFVSRRGFCKHIYSDGGSNFIGANAELKNVIERNNNVAEELVANDIMWHFNPPSAPHFGGLWEAGVKSLKHHLKRIVGETIMTYEELNTVLTQIEACLNSRPLCPLSEDPNDLAALTPGHFLIGDVPLAVPEDNLLDLKIHHLNRWQLTQRTIQHFWRQWSSEHISRLQQRPKWLETTPNVREGDLVLVKDDRCPSYKWPLGRIIKTSPGTDGRVRVVTVKMQNSSFQRPITKIAPLPINDNYDQQELLANN